MATQDRVSTTPASPELPAPSSSNGRRSIRAILRGMFSFGRTQREDELDVTTPYGERENNSLSFIKSHLAHGVADIVLSLLGFAVAINSAFVTFPHCSPIFPLIFCAGSLCYQAQYSFLALEDRPWHKLPDYLMHTISYAT